MSRPAADPARLRARYRRIVFLTLFLTLDLIMFGAFVRLSDSGLGCPDWPGCYGSFSPFGARDHIGAAVDAQPYGPVTHAKAWIEMVHRYVGAILGMLLIAIAWMAWRHREALRQSPTLAVVSLVAVCIQGAFGAWTVTHKLMPVVVTTHLLGGMALLALLTWLGARQKAHDPVPAEAWRWRVAAGVGLGLLGVQIALGGWVSTNYAALACLDFPTCHGEWVPDMDFHGGFSLVRALGELPSGEIISQNALTAIHWVHRNFAFIVFVYLGWLAHRLSRFPGLRGPARLLAAFLVLQVLTGIATIFLQWPLLLAVIHNGGAAVLTMACTTLVVRTARAGKQPPAADDKITS
ncbi:COX15/CtaA family protein [Achromobacter sp. GG226]|uniref:COX15/CtaA family protein n=1 Tax=Verticiella alkaliphila TaxID=2779529 RepID=UPI001C0D6F2A|nr:COX15/CtaA family protein [Verticiella sp. GG226]MBU4611671.1 COX15/CtaA family protein [Verticiella sp. GG226]